MGSLLRSNVGFNVKKIAIVGAGPSGLAGAKYLLAERAFSEIDIYEQQSEVGGVWNYSPHSAELVQVPQISPFIPPQKPFWPKDASSPIFPNPMYEKLITNIPKNLMQFSDQSFDDEALLYPTRQDVQSYLVRYSQEVRHLIKFSTQVKDIRVVDENGNDRWSLIAESTITQERSQKIYDAVVVANGHYAVPFIPSVPGIAEFHSTYPSVISHSKIYRSPDSFSEKKVVVVGNAASGLDIGNQISEVCKGPLLNSVHRPSMGFVSRNKEEVSAIIEYLVEDRAVRFKDGRIEKNIDAVVYCTGYLYSFPFFNSIVPPLLTSGRRTSGLWQHLFNIAHPSLAFTALPQKIIPFPISEGQGAAIAKVWSNKLKLPSKDEMQAWERRRVEESGEGTAFHVLGYPHDANYINYLHDWVMTAENGDGKEPPFWDEELRWTREIYVEIRKKFIETGGTARTIEELGFKFQERDLNRTKLSESN